MSEAFFEAFMIMVIGIGTVFTFLVLLLAAMRLLQSLTAPAVEANPQSVREDSVTAAQATALVPATVAAITAAVQRYRRSHNN